MQQSIILIGAPRVGKSTAGRLLGQKLGLPFVDLNTKNKQYFADAGLTDDQEAQHWAAGYESYYRLLKPFEAAALERGLAEHPGSIVEVPGSQAVYEDRELMERVRKALAPYGLVVRLLPAHNADDALQTILERQRIMFGGVEVNEYFVRHPSNGEVATITTYTAGQTPEQSTQELLGRLDPSDRTVVLIGPISSGKSTIGRLLAEQLGRPEVALDRVRWDYYGEIGWAKTRQDEIIAADGVEGMVRYWKPFEIHAVERVLAEHAGSVIHFGAGHSVFDAPEHVARLRAALAPLRNVVLLLPSPDVDESLAVLRERNTFRVGGVELNRYLLTHSAMAELATATVSTDGKTPEQTRDEILALLDGAPGPD